MARAHASHASDLDRTGAPPRDLVAGLHVKTRIGLHRVGRGPELAAQALGREVQQRVAPLVAAAVQDVGLPAPDGAGQPLTEPPAADRRGHQLTGCRIGTIGAAGFGGTDEKPYLDSNCPPPEHHSKSRQDNGIG